MKKVSRERVGQELDGMFNGRHNATLMNLIVACEFLLAPSAVACTQLQACVMACEVGRLNKEHLCNQ